MISYIIKLIYFLLLLICPIKAVAQEENNDKTNWQAEQTFEVELQRLPDQVVVVGCIRLPSKIINSANSDDDFLNGNLNEFRAYSKNENAFKHWPFSESAKGLRASFAPENAPFKG